MSLDRHDTRARLLSFEGRQAKTAPAAFPHAYIVVAGKKQSRQELRFAALLVVQKNACSQLLCGAQHSIFYSSYSQAAAFLGSGPEFRSAAASLRITRRS